MIFKEDNRNREGKNFVCLAWKKWNHSRMMPFFGC